MQSGLIILLEGTLSLVVPIAVAIHELVLLNRPVRRSGPDPEPPPPAPPPVPVAGQAPQKQVRTRELEPV